MHKWIIKDWAFYIVFTIPLTLGKNHWKLWTPNILNRKMNTNSVFFDPWLGGFCEVRYEEYEKWHVMWTSWDQLLLLIICFLLWDIILSTTRNRRVGPLNPLQSPSREIACWLLIKQFPSTWLWFLSVLLDCTFWEEPFIFENKLFSMFCYYLTHQHHLLCRYAQFESRGKGFFVHPEEKDRI